MTKLREIKEDIWKFHNSNHYIVIPTNGDINRFGRCVMGRGLALQAHNKFSKMPEDIAYHIAENIRMSGNKVFIMPLYHIITFPVKEHWNEKARLDLIEKSVEQLAIDVEKTLNFVTINFPIYLPRVGCGNGKLNWEEVKPILEKYLNSSRFVICDKEEKERQKQ